MKQTSTPTTAKAAAQAAALTALATLGMAALVTFPPAAIPFIYATWRLFRRWRDTNPLLRAYEAEVDKAMETPNPLHAEGKEGAER